MDQEVKSYIDAGVKLTVAVLLLIYSKRIATGIYKIFAGDDGVMDKKEFGAFIMLGLGAYMIFKEGARTHDWHLYNELYIFTVFSMAAFGLGLDTIANTIIKFKHGNNVTMKDEEVKDERVEEP